MSKKTNNPPLVLVILDGWGYSEKKSNNAIALAQTPHWDDWWQSAPHIFLEASGPAVGLPVGQMGNSEVGHMHMGAGRLILQDLTRIQAAIEQGDFAENPILQGAIETLKKKERSLHVMGLLSPGGVHSHEDHLYALLDVCEQQGFKAVSLHLFLDGRDTSPQSALVSIKKLEAYLEKNSGAKLASIVGRYYAMDRDKRWDRTEKAYALISEGKAPQAFDKASEALRFFYAKGIYDEFIPPTLIGKAKPMQQGDSLFFFNFRADRARQLSQAFLQTDFADFPRPKGLLELSAFISMTQYADYLPTQALFPPLVLKQSLGEVISQADLRQLRLAETEKYAHVTFFFNGGKERPFPLEERQLIPSPKVATYDLCPEMNAPALTEALVKAILEEKYELIICNYANADMVGHSGCLEPTILAIECLDRCLGKVGEALKAVNGNLLITADHGNAELMYDSLEQQAHTAHTSNLVPCLFVGKDWDFVVQKGSLIDIAPTVLRLLGLTIPQEMTGRALLASVC